MSTIDLAEVTEELVVFLRNSDILTTEQRGVQTYTQTFNLVFTNKVLSTYTGVRNVRSTNLGLSQKVYRKDYTTNYNREVSGLKYLQVTYNQSFGKGSVVYDYGRQDRIYPVYPQTAQDEIYNLEEFPRITVQIISLTSEAGGLGNVNKSELTFSVNVYDESQTNVENYITAVRDAFITSYNNFKYFGPYVRELTTSPMMVYEEGKQKIFQQSIDFTSPHNYEKNNDN